MQKERAEPVRMILGRWISICWSRSVRIGFKSGVSTRDLTAQEGLGAGRRLNAPAACSRGGELAGEGVSGATELRLGRGLAVEGQR